MWVTTFSTQSVINGVLKKRNRTVAKYILNFTKANGMFGEVDCIDKETAVTVFSQILCRIFERTFSGKQIFNLNYLIRQNFLTIIETESIMKYLFGKTTFSYVDDDGIERRLQRLEEDVVKCVRERNGYKEINIRAII